MHNVVKPWENIQKTFYAKLASMFYLFNFRAVIYPHENLSSQPLSELFQRTHDWGMIYGQIDPS